MSESHLPVWSLESLGVTEVPGLPELRKSTNR